MRWMDYEKPIIGLAPMADFTDLPFCRLIRECGAQQTVIFREMVSAEALVRGNKKTLKSLDIHVSERPVVQQLFGSDPQAMAEAALIVEKRVKPEGLDINMGCPVHKAVSNFNGASLMREPDKAAQIIKAIKSVVSVPLSVKTRLGWSRPDEILSFAKVVEDAGADALEIHGRTKDQGYAGRADWQMVGRVVKEVKIPVLVNGDITDTQTAQQALAVSGAAGLLIGRGALGHPWIFQEISASLSGRGTVEQPSIQQKMDYLRRHAELQIEHYGQNGLIKLRKHFPWYFKGIPGFRQFRAQAVRITTLSELEELIETIGRT